MADVYSLPKLRYGYAELAPYVSELQLTIHHQKHHQAYVSGANSIFERMEKARKEGADYDAKSTLKELSFNVGGHVLHSLFWDNMAPSGQGGGSPGGRLGDAIDKEFGGIERFKKEFAKAAATVEGSGWAALAVEKASGKLLIMQIEKHNTNLYPNSSILLVLDVFEHAYYIDYKNDRAKFIDAVWSIVNWDEAARRLG